MDGLLALMSRVLDEMCRFLFASRKIHIKNSKEYKKSVCSELNNYFIMGYVFLLLAIVNLHFLQLFRSSVVHVGLFVVLGDVFASWILFLC